MKKYIKHIIYTLIVIIVAVFLSTHAKTDTKSDNKENNAEHINDSARDLFYKGSSYFSSTDDRAELKSDNYILTTDSISFDKAIFGNIYSVSDHIDVIGNVVGGVYLASNSTNIKGIINNDLHAAVAESIKIEESANVKGDVVIFSGANVEITGTIDGDAHIFASDKIIIKDGVINGLANLKANYIEIIGNSSLNGAVNIETQLKDPLIADSAFIASESTYIGTSKEVSDASKDLFKKAGATFATVFLLALLLHLGLRNFNTNIQNTAINASKTFLSLFIFLASTILTMFIAIVLLFIIPQISSFLFTIILLTLVLIFVVFVAAYASLAGYIGNFIARLLQKEFSTIDKIFFGSILLAVITLIPFIDVLVFFFVTIYLSGAAFYQIFHSLRK